MKLSNFFEGNTFTITQSPHGALQGGQAIDCVPSYGNKLIAPCDMDIYYRKNDLGHQSYSYARGQGFKIVFVHCIIEKSGNVKRGEYIGRLATGGDIHLHTAIEVNGVWDCVLNYMDRSINLALSGDFSSKHWMHWSTWKDLNLLSNNVEILKQTYEEAKSGFNDLFGYFEAHGLRADLARYVKDGGDSVSWIINNGRTELRGMFDAVVKARNALQAEIGQKNKLIESQVNEIGKIKHDLEVLQNQYDNVEPTIKELNETIARLNSEKGTLETRYKNLEKAYKKCIEGKKGNKADYIKILKSIVESFRKLLTKFGRKK